MKFRKKKENNLNIHFMIYHRNLVLFPHHILKIILRFDDFFPIHKRRNIKAKLRFHRFPTVSVLSVINCNIEYFE